MIVFRQDSILCGNWHICNVYDRSVKVRVSVEWGARGSVLVNAFKMTCTNYSMSPKTILEAKGGSKIMQFLTCL